MSIGNLLALSGSVHRYSFGTVQFYFYCSFCTLCLFVYWFSFGTQWVCPTLFFWHYATLFVLFIGICLALSGSVLLYSFGTLWACQFVLFWHFMVLFCQLVAMSIIILKVFWHSVAMSICTVLELCGYVYLYSFDTLWLCLFVLFWHFWHWICQLICFWDLVALSNGAL